MTYSGPGKLDKFGGLKCYTEHIMPKKQTHPTAIFKAQVVLEMLKEEKTVTQIAADHQIHPGPLHRWKRQALDNFRLFLKVSGLFLKGDDQELEDWPTLRTK